MSSALCNYIGTTPAHKPGLYCERIIEGNLKNAEIVDVNNAYLDVYIENHKIFHEAEDDICVLECRLEITLEYLHEQSLRAYCDRAFFLVYTSLPASFFDDSNLVFEPTVAYAQFISVDGQIYYFANINIAIDIL